MTRILFVSLLWKVLSEILVRGGLVTCNIGGQTLKSFRRGEISSYFIVIDKKGNIFLSVNSYIP